jgi:rod shape-determining protein MreD
VLFVWYAACCGLAFLICYLIVRLGRPERPSILALIGQVGPDLLLFPFANQMIERFEDGDVQDRSFPMSEGTLHLLLGRQ